MHDVALKCQEQNLLNTSPVLNNSRNTKNDPGVSVQTVTWI